MVNSAKPEKSQIDSTSQVEPSDAVFQMLANWHIGRISTASDLSRLKDNMHASLTVRDYNDSVADAERQIRWTRTGSQVLTDGYVYRGKACTDHVVAFLTLTKAAGIEEARFVRLKNDKTGAVHSVAEIKLPDGWYTFDVTDPTATPRKGKIEPERLWGGPPYGPFSVWKKGRDLWDLGLTNLDLSNTIET